MDGQTITALESGVHRAIAAEDLFCGLEYSLIGSSDPHGLTISSITADSRTVIPGTLFVALRGGSSDGHSFIAQAAQAGASAIMVETPVAEEVLADLPGIPVLRVADTRQALGQCAARLYGSPAETMTMIGITGTNGKTTVSYLLEHALAIHGIKVGIIGTVDYRYPGLDGKLVHYPAPFTTPDPVMLHATLREMSDCGVTHVVMEVSSHALAQQRLGPITFALALFTNLSQDHLDFHLRLEDYFQAKCQLFTKYAAANGTVVIVRPDSREEGEVDWSGRLIETCHGRGLKTTVCGTGNDDDFRLINGTCSLTGSTLIFRDQDNREHVVQSPLVGRFNLLNLLTAVAGLNALGFAVIQAIELLSDASGAPGRLQRVGLSDKPAGQPTVLVDYAHTPDALDKVLSAVTELPHRTMYCVVGCGGDRDRSKRPIMGRIGAVKADVHCN